MRYLLNIAILCVLATSFSSCKDDDITELKIGSEVENEVETLLTSGQWIRVGFERNGLDVWSIYPECTKDDYYNYLSGGMAFVDQAALVCDSTSTQRVEWNWELMDNNQILRENISDTVSYDRDIIELTDTSFIFSTYYRTDTLTWYHVKK